LPFSRCLYPLTYRRRDLAQPVAAQLLVIHARDFDPAKTMRDNVWMSILSSKGPEIRFWYFVTTAGANPQAFCGSLNHPHGQGCTQSNSFFLLYRKQKDDFESVPERPNVKSIYSYKLRKSAGPDEMVKIRIILMS
jgi:hypothetical protein